MTSLERQRPSGTPSAGTSDFSEYAKTPAYDLRLKLSFNSAKDRCRPFQPCVGQPSLLLLILLRVNPRNKSPDKMPRRDHLLRHAAANAGIRVFLNFPPNVTRFLILYLLI